MIVARLSAWGAAGGRGFDSLVQAASGIAWIESADGRTPGALPAQALDHTAGYALAAAVLTALRRRGEVGGSWLVETSLRRVAAELLGMPRDAGGDLAEPVDPDRFLQHFTVGGHDVVTAGRPWPTRGHRRGSGHRSRGAPAPRSGSPLRQRRPPLRRTGAVVGVRSLTGRPSRCPGAWGCWRRPRPRSPW
jgi:hypothetical protein